MIVVALLGFVAVLVGCWVLRWVAAGVPALDVDDPNFDQRELDTATEKVSGRGPRQWPKLVGRDW